MDATLNDRNLGADMRQCAYLVLEPRHTQAFVEVNMASAKADNSRFYEPTEMVLQTGVTWGTRMVNYKAEADACQAKVLWLVPPHKAKKKDACSTWRVAMQVT